MVSWASTNAGHLAECCLSFLADVSSFSRPSVDLVVIRMPSKLHCVEQSKPKTTHNSWWPQNSSLTSKSCHSARQLSDPQLRSRVFFCTHAMGVFLTASALGGPEDARVMRPAQAEAAAGSALPLFILPRPLPSPAPASTAQSPPSRFAH